MKNLAAFNALSYQTVFVILATANNGCQICSSRFDRNLASARPTVFNLSNTAGISDHAVILCLAAADASLSICLSTASASLLGRMLMMMVLVLVGPGIRAILRPANVLGQ